MRRTREQIESDLYQRSMRAPLEPASVRTAHAAQRGSAAEPPRPYSIAIARLRAAGRLPAATPTGSTYDEHGTPTPWRAHVEARRAAEGSR
jgi:hypothetical protein